MEAPLFSQIPNIVLNKIKKPIGSTKRKFAKFYDEPVIEGSQSEEVTSSGSEGDIIHRESPDEFVESIPSEVKPKIGKKVKFNVSFAEDVAKDITVHCPTCACNKKMADAITKTDSVEVESHKTQTDNEFPAMEPHEIMKKELEAQSLSAFKGGQMYSIPKADKAPLKLGLTARGKKRIVYYPDEVYARQD